MKKGHDKVSEKYYEIVTGSVEQPKLLTKEEFMSGTLGLIYLNQETGKLAFKEDVEKK